MAYFHKKCRLLLGGLSARPTRGKVGLCPRPPLDAGNASSAMTSASERSGDENSDDVKPDCD